jgi:hypothetical protein
MPGVKPLNVSFGTQAPARPVPAGTAVGLQMKPGFLQFESQSHSWAHSPRSPSVSMEANLKTHAAFGGPESVSASPQEPGLPIVQSVEQNELSFVGTLVPSVEHVPMHVVDDTSGSQLEPRGSVPSVAAEQSPERGSQERPSHSKSPRQVGVQ